MPRLIRHTPDFSGHRAHWTDRAACRGEDPAIFFPEDFPRSEVPLVVKQAQAVCGRCPVRLECLAAALERPESAGVWGGLDKGPRQDLRRRQMRARRRRARRQGGGGGGNEKAAG